MPATRAPLETVRREVTRIVAEIGGVHAVLSGRLLGIGPLAAAQ